MRDLVEYLIDGDRLTPEERARMGRSLLRAVHREAARFQTDVPELSQSDPPEVRAAAEVLRTAAGKTSAADRGYTMTGWLDATDSRLWDAYVTFMPWSIDGDVWDGEGRLILSVADGAVISVAGPMDGAVQLVAIVGVDRLVPHRDVKAARRAGRWGRLTRHPDSVVGVAAAVVGLLLLPLPGPGWLVFAAGVLLWMTGAIVRRIRRHRRRFRLVEPVQGECPACGHDWSEHLPDLGHCSECDYEISHDEPQAPMVSCTLTPPLTHPSPRGRDTL